MTKKIPFRTHYSPHLRVSFETEGESLTEQQYAEESKILTKIRKFDSQGFFDSINRNPAQYSDFSEITDLASAIDQIQSAEESFMTIPSDIRKQFNNSSSEFFKFASDAKNYDELVQMGLAYPSDQVLSRVSSPVVEEKKEEVDQATSSEHS